jgi:prepilin signal peptidase PulO-like enzyme (type II secretory pathway)
MLMLNDSIVYGLVAALFGLIFGSAINAVVWRLYVGRSWVKGRSECPDCGHKLAAKDLVPVASWLMLGGKCRYCKAAIKDHPVVELVTAILFGLSAYMISPHEIWGWAMLGWWLVILVMLIVLAVYDARWMILPDKITLPLGVLVIGLDIVLAVQAKSLGALVGPAEAALLWGGAFWLLVLVSKGRAMGGGDIKLAFVMGLLLGLKASALAMLVAFNTAAFVGVVLIVLKRRGRKDHIPFGPFLVLGAVVAYLFAEQVVRWYLRMNGLE